MHLQEGIANTKTKSIEFSKNKHKVGSQRREKSLEIRVKKADLVIKVKSK
jgi:hypothetical protein